MLVSPNGKPQHTPNVNYIGVSRYSMGALKRDAFSSCLLSGWGLPFFFEKAGFLDHTYVYPYMFGLDV